MLLGYATPLGAVEAAKPATAWTAGVGTVWACRDVAEPAIVAADLAPVGAGPAARDHCRTLWPLGAREPGLTAAAYRACVLGRLPATAHDAAELYANGWGVKRDVKQAVALMCSATATPGERVEMLRALQHVAQGVHKGPYIWCNHASSQANSAVCAATARNVEAFRRRQALTAMRDPMTAPQKVTFDAWQAMAQRHIHQHAEKEIDLTGATGGAFADAALQYGEEQAFAWTALVQTGKTPPPAPPLADAKKRLAAAIRGVRGSDRWLVKGGGPTLRGVLATQRAWVQTLAAAMKWARSVHPDGPLDALEAILTEQRIAELEVQLAPAQRVYSIKATADNPDTPVPPPTPDEP